MNGIKFSLYLTFFALSKPLWSNSYILTDRLNKVRTKLKNVIKSFEMSLNSKHKAEKIKTKNQKKKNMKN